MTDKKFFLLTILLISVIAGIIIYFGEPAWPFYAGKIKTTNIGLENNR